MMVSYSAGRYRQMMRTSGNRPIWVYSAVLDDRTRPEHRALHNKAFRFDNPFWETNYPPNGWHCRCGVYSLSEDGAKSRGIEILDEVPESINENKITPPEWRYNPGKEKWSPDWSKYEYLKNILSDGRSIDELKEGEKKVTALDVIKEKYKQDVSVYEMNESEWNNFIDKTKGTNKTDHILRLISVVDNNFSQATNIDKIFVDDSVLWHSRHADNNRKKKNRIYPEWDDLKKVWKILKEPKYICREKETGVLFWIYDHKDNNVISVTINKGTIKTVKIIEENNVIDTKQYEILYKKSK